MKTMKGADLIRKVQNESRNVKEAYDTLLWHLKHSILVNETELQCKIAQSDLFVREAEAMELRTERERKIARLFAEKSVNATLREILGDAP